MTDPVPAGGWVEIDPDAITHNIRTIRAALGDPVEFCGVVKADAYGHGIDIVAPLLAAEGVTMIGVASNEDAAAVRSSGFTGRLMRVRPAGRDEVDDGIRFAIEEWIGGAEHAETVSAVAAARGTRIRAHLSLNSTGLGRDGIEASQPPGVRVARGVLADPLLDVVGICSHFPCEDEADVAAGTASFDRQSLAVLDGVEAGAVSRHCATTFAALHVPESWFDLVRIGAGVYGDTDALGGALRPAMRVVSRIAAINSYPAGSTVGYDRWHRLDADARLALIPLGYADGFHRSLSGTGEVLVRGERARIVDRIAMNSFLVDVSHIADAAPGDEVVLFGAQGGQAITSADVDRAHGSIAADLYVAWGRLLPRRTVGASGVSAAAAASDAVMVAG
ncbi:alanine racemase [Microbacterium oxydans]|uniref:Alanine racemase n=1 Tax=Microbacterium oxydans TaxID=82380 RepID=A0A0F0LPB6_9MICO|nr:alanine racemase [Microbacterium oxydans]KJL33366.1 Alanine racemase [Microbacterium oxydans]